MADKIKFWPIRGTESQILEQPYYDGKIYFAYDTNKIYLDVDGSKHLMGGGNSGIIYAKGTDTTIIKVSENEEEVNYYIDFEALENANVLPQQNDLILNSDGRFFRVLSVNAAESKLTALLLAVSGTGGGGGTTPVANDLTLSVDTQTVSANSTYIFGQEYYINFTVTSTIDDAVSATVKFYEGAYSSTKEPIFTSPRIDGVSGEPMSFNMGLVDHVGSNISIRIEGTSDNSQMENGVVRNYSGLRFIDMHIAKPTSTNNNYITAVTENTPGGLQLRYIPYGAGLNRVTLHLAVDGSEIFESSEIITSFEESKTVSVPDQAHGTHKISLWLSTEVNGVTLSSTPIYYEASWIKNGENIPVIWIGDVQNLVIQYENAVIPYMVYNSEAELNGEKTDVVYYRNGVKVGTDSVKYNGSGWIYWDVTSLYQLGENRFTITNGIASKEVVINVTDEGSKDLSLKNQSSLVLNLDSGGRSSYEIKSNRATWESTKGSYSAIFENFNWYNNGWKNDDDGFGSYLSIANGASLRIPFGIIAMNTGSEGWSFEMRFRIRNAHKYATLVTEIPKYGWIDQDGKIIGIDYIDESGKIVKATGAPLTLDQIAARGGTLYRDGDGNPVMNEKDTTEKIVEDTNNVAMKYVNADGEGFCIGTQEAYFKTAGKVVNVRYKEGEIINISFVVDKPRETLSIYLNGILSGAVNLNGIRAIRMENIPFLVNSEYCDFDLYKLRVYHIALTMPEVIHNYISDLKSITLYDENKLTEDNDDFKLSYEKLLAYNVAHPDAPSMPYVVIDSTATPNDQDLPHFKGGNKKVRIEFTNPTADYLLNQGLISEYQYYTHCPSYVADGVDINVQGTSSMKYPRRNFKTKFKDAGTSWVYTQGSLADKPISKGGSTKEGEKISKKWHMDSELLGTNKFTWKIDYMESSGSYNTGFANLMGTGIYDKHPLEDLHINGLDASIYRTSVYGFPTLWFHKTLDDNGKEKYLYIGRYNCNLDKGSNEYYGFEEEIEHPFINAPWDEIDKDTGEVTAHHDHPYIADVAECWELRDNQGTWCSFRYPSDNARQTKFATYTADSYDDNGILIESDKKLEVGLHFEPRYHTMADEIEAAQAYTPKTDDGDDFSDIIGNNNNAICNWLRGKMSNLEILFNWLDSTDTRTVTNRVFDEPIEMPVSATSNDNTVTYETRDVTTDGNTVTKTFGTFTADTIEYRRQKFWSEFEEHLDKHYCTIYFIMTELLLCYDSRGKNMMIATFGPHKQGGDYIWYPIFYDIDTQLGLNNVGAWLWDYNADCTEDNIFSTASSVLWTNFNDLFRSDIISVYQALRKTKLDYTTIEGAYICDPNVFRTSYAMRGKRPIIAIGLDEYYKYVLPVTEKWKTQEGTWDTADYLYACQGDRILSRELLINNRLLYMDSKWMGGDFDVKKSMSGISFRITANNPVLTSDKYIESSNPASNQEFGAYPVPFFDATMEYYVTPYLDFYVTYFTDQNTFMTRESYDAIKYPNGIPTATSDAVLGGFKTGTVDQQLNYFAGSNYISSLGDLSTKYVNEVSFGQGNRLLDITLGSDVPGYFNDETLNPFDLKLGVNDNEKPLLEKIILSNMRKLETFLDVRNPKKLQEFRALGTKLQYVLFAEGAPLNTVHLPATTQELHFIQNKNLTHILREKPEVLVLDENGNATYDSEDRSKRPIYKDRSEYDGLYVEGLTDYNPVNAGTGSPIAVLEFEGDALGYDSYEILKNAVDLKKGSGVEKNLKISMTEVHWSPYQQVEYGEMPVTGTQYYFLTDHSKFEPYSNTSDSSAWASNTLNGRIYTYTAGLNEHLITDLSLLDDFIADYTAAMQRGSINQFTNNNSATMTVPTVPTLTGEMYIANENGDAIDEDLLTSKYGQYWKSLSIKAAKINESYLGKYVQIDMNTGKEILIDTIRYNPTEYEGRQVTLTEKTVGVPQTYDFRGWAYEPIDPLATDIESKLAYDVNTGSWTELGRSKVFSAEQTVITLYAVFTQTLYTVHYINPDGVEITTRQTTYGKPIPDPQELPVYDPGNLGLTEVYSFKGYTREINNALPANKSRLSSILINLNSALVTEDNIRIYAVYLRQSVYDEPTSLDYFDFGELVTYDEQDTNIPDSAKDTSYNKTGYIINIKEGAKLRGKVTLPNYYGKHPIIGLGLTFTRCYSSSLGSEITHIFWEKATADKPHNLRELSSYDNSPAGAKMNLQFIQIPEGTRIIGRKFFMSLESLKTLTSVEDNPVENSIILPSTIAVINESAFNDAFAVDSQLNEISVPGATAFISRYAFANKYCSVGTFNIGSSAASSQLVKVDQRSLIDNTGSISGAVYSHNSGLTSNMNFYYSTQEQYTNFEMIESYFNGIETKSYKAPINS